jgi:putative proteasome-type protease
LLVYEANSLTIKSHLNIESDNPYYQQLRSRWGERLRQAFNEMPDPEL